MTFEVEFKEQEELGRMKWKIWHQSFQLAGRGDTNVGVPRTSEWPDSCLGLNAGAAGQGWALQSPQGGGPCWAVVTVWVKRYKEGFKVSVIGGFWKLYIDEERMKMIVRLILFLTMFQILCFVLYIYEFIWFLKEPHWVTDNLFIL